MEKNCITLSVDSKGVQQLGSSQLSSQKANVQRHEARVQALPVGHTRFSSYAHCLSFGQQTVDKVNSGATHHVNQSILKQKERQKT